MNAENINRMFRGVTGLGGDRLWLEDFQLSCEVHWQQSELELKGLKDRSSFVLVAMQLTN